MKILVGISGSSSVYLGFKLLQNLEKKSKVFCVLTQHAKSSFLAENPQFKWDLQNFSTLACEHFSLTKTQFLCDDDLCAGASSGSFGITKTIIAPCSVSTLAKIHSGLGDTLLTRACIVALKERKKLILAVREMPFSTLNLEHMSKLSQLGAIIAPPIVASYFGLRDLEGLENFIVGKWLDLLEIPHNLYQKWERPQ